MGLFVSQSGPFYKMYENKKKIINHKHFTLNIFYIYFAEAQNQNVLKRVRALPVGGIKFYKKKVGKGSQRL